MSGDELLRAYLATHDAACAGCGYGLRGLTGATCPECGERLTLRVGARERLSLMWTAGVVAWSMIVPLWAIQLCWMVMRYSWLGTGNFVQVWLKELLVFTLVVPLNCAGLLIWIRRYRRDGPRSWVASRLVNMLVLGLISFFTLIWVFYLHNPWF